MLSLLTCLANRCRPMSDVSATPLGQPCKPSKKVHHGQIVLNYTLDWSKKQFARICVKPTPHYHFGTTVLRGELASITLLRNLISSFTVAHHTLSPLLRRVIYPTFASMDGMNGATFGITRQPFRRLVKYSAASLALHEVLVMKCTNGSSKAMVASYRAALYAR